MRIVVDRELCEVNGVCMGEAPDVFQIDEQNRMVVVHQRPGADVLSEVRQAVKRCPRGALSLEDD